MTKQRSTEFRAALEAAVSSFGLDPLTEAQVDRCVAHYEMLCKWNERINLTRIIRPEEAARLHYAESMFGARFIEDGQSVLDIGSGAGFPAIPLAIVRSDLEVTAIEANQKKALFLNEVKDHLRIENLRIVHARLEDFDWAGYDVLTSRALERMETASRSLMEGMPVEQKLMLYCAADLVAKLEHATRARCRVTTHAMPMSESRVVAIFSNCGAPPLGFESS